MTELQIGDVCVIERIALDDHLFEKKEELVGKQVTIGDYLHAWKDGYVACTVKLGGKTILFHAVNLKKVAEKSG